MLAAVGGWRFARASAPVNGPIVLISVDALRADHLPVYGYDGVDTPAIDALAADGIVFERAFSHVPSTLPSHATLMTGRLPFRTGVRGNVGFAIHASETLLAEVLRDRAYATAAVVSSYALRRDSGIAQGFTLFDDEFLDGAWSGRRDELQRDGADVQRIAAQWLDSVGTERVFLFLHLDDPQSAHEPARGADTYDAGIEYADHVIGEMVDHLKSNQLYDQSTVILVSDHGEGLGDHGERTHGLLIYDEALRVPLIIKPAASVEGGRRISEVVQLVDLMPTIVDLAKAPLPDGVDGQSLTALLDGAERLAARVTYSESMYGRLHFGWSELRAITDGRYRYVSAPREELYDLDADPGEAHNIIDMEPDVADRLRTALRELVASDTILAPADVPAPVRARFAAIGDVGDVRDHEREVPDTPINPVDRTEFVDAYRQGVRLFAEGQWFEGLSALEQLARSDPSAIDVWRDLAGMAAHAARHELAVEAFRRVVALDAEAADARLGAAWATFHLRRLDDADRRAHAVLATLGEGGGGEGGGEAAARAHELLARVALQRRDTATALAHALEGENAVPRLPLVSYVEGRRHFEQERYEEALEAFEAAITRVERGQGAPGVPDLYLHAAAALEHLGRPDEAARLYAREIAAYPRTMPARLALATLHQEAGRPDEATRTLMELVRYVPTPDAYNLAARHWATFGDVQQAAAVRAEARRLFTVSTDPRAVHQ